MSAKRRTAAVVWGLYAATLFCAPYAFNGSLALGILSQLGIGIIAALAFNILLGQGGMLSFGQAVYSGLGSFAAIHVMAHASRGGWPVPVTLLPLVGGLAGMLAAAVLGYVTTKRSGTAFAMITLGVGELVAAMSLMFPELFGGEGGISGNRVYGVQPFGITYGTQLQVYYLIAAYTLACTWLMYALTATPLGRMLNATRDNPERVEFVGYSTHRIRYLAFIASGLFLGISGGLAAINFEIITSETVGAARSGAYVLFTFVGGVNYFAGPIIGALLMVTAYALLSEITKAWLLYLGLTFMLMVMYAPGGLADLLALHLRVAAFGKLRQLAGPYALLGLLAIPCLAACSLIIEMIYYIQLNASSAGTFAFLGMAVSPSDIRIWIAALGTLFVAGPCFEFARRKFVNRWAHIQSEIHAQVHAQSDSK